MMELKNKELSSTRTRTGAGGAAGTKSYNMPYMQPHKLKSQVSHSFHLRAHTLKSQVKKWQHLVSVSAYMVLPEQYVSTWSYLSSMCLHGPT